MDSYVKFRVISGIISGIIAIIMGAYILVSALIVNCSKQVYEGALISILGIIVVIVCVIIIKKKKK